MIFIFIMMEFLVVVPEHVALVMEGIVLQYCTAACTALVFCRLAKEIFFFAVTKMLITKKNWLSHFHCCCICYYNIYCLFYYYYYYYYILSFTQLGLFESGLLEFSILDFWYYSILFQFLLHTLFYWLLSLLEYIKIYRRGNIRYFEACTWVLKEDFKSYRYLYFYSSLGTLVP